MFPLPVNLPAPVLYAGMAIVALGAAYLQGRNDCAIKHAHRAAQEAAEWADKISASEAEAYERGLQAARRDAENARSVEEIVRNAGMELGAHDECISADTAERLRQLQ